MNNLKISAPWNIYAKRVIELFKYDKDISVVYDDSNPFEITIYVDGSDKTDALCSIMPTEKKFGNVSVKTYIIPSNKKKNPLDYFQSAFKNNPVFSKVIASETPDNESIGYVMFKPEAAQYYADNVFINPYGYVTELYANVARGVFGDIEGIGYSSDLKDINDGGIEE